MGILVKAIIGTIAGLVIGYFVNLFFQHGFGIVPDPSPQEYFVIFGLAVGLLFGLKNKKIWIYHCPKCNKIIDDNDVFLPIGGSLLGVWKLEMYTWDALYFRCSACNAHIKFNWTTPMIRQLLYQFIYAAIFFTIYNRSSLKNLYDTTGVLGVYGIGLITIFIICFIHYSNTARLELVEDKKLSPNAEPVSDTEPILDFSGESEPVKYCLGHPDFNDIKEGMVEISDGKIIFKEQYGNKIYFDIPIKQVIEVKTSSKLLSSSIYNAIGSMGGARSYLFIKFRRNDQDYMVEFSTLLRKKSSTIIERLKKQIIEAKSKVQ